MGADNGGKVPLLVRSRVLVKDSGSSGASGPASTKSAKEMITGPVCGGSAREFDEAITVGVLCRCGLNEFIGCPEGVRRICPGWFMLGSSPVAKIPTVRVGPVR
jgi:hypothetical protein